jgi:hypothetical protein
MSLSGLKSFFFINFRQIIINMAYSFENSKGKTYYLHTKDVTLKGGRNQTIYYFAKDQRPNACDLPAGKKVVENERTGLPFVKSA